MIKALQATVFPRIGSQQATAMQATILPSVETTTPIDMGAMMSMMITMMIVVMMMKMMTGAMATV